MTGYLLTCAYILAGLGGAHRVKKVVCRWYVYTGKSGNSYTFQGGTGVGFYLRRGWDLFGDCKIHVGSVRTDDVDYDEKFVDLRAQAKSMAKRLNKIGKP